MISLIRAPLAFLSFFYQSIYLAAGQIWANKTRSILTTIGIVIGVASVTAVIATLSGLKHSILKRVENFGTNTLIILPFKSENEGLIRRAPTRIVQFEPEDFDGLLKHCPSVDKLSRIANIGRYTVRSNENSVESVNIQGIETAYHDIEHRPIILGRKISVIDDMQVRYVCLIDSKLQDKLRLGRNCIGESILLGRYRFRIIGVFEWQPPLDLGQSVDNYHQVFIPFSTTFKLQRPFIMAWAASKATELSEEAKAEMNFFFRRKLNIKPNEPDTFSVSSLQTQLDTFEQISMVVTLVAGGIVGISLLVGGVGIMNIMLVSVSERTREIGLRKAVGAKKSAILTQFLVESVVLCFIGGFVGLGVGQLIILLISTLISLLEMTSIPLWAIFLSFAFCGCVGIFFGIFPALKAARLDPIEALRHE
ncbi:MAG: ABC transporter permease [Sedimentisphaerales bacterium]|nr:ABC transporter permease [Sedimentisphaerales bacterium]